MQWQGRRSSSNRQSGGRGPSGAGLTGGALIAGIVIYLLTGNPFLAVHTSRGVNQLHMQFPSGQQQEIQLTDEEKNLYDFSGVVLADTEDCWNTILPRYGVEYREPTMLIFQNSIKTGCGLADSGLGPFYCGADETVYMDLSFYRLLVNHYGAEEGDFVMSYVISHEVGHHVQKCLGILDQVNKIRAKSSKAKANELSVRLELQADYLAGVVAHYQKQQGYLEKGDIEEAIRTAWVIGDDAIEKKSQGYVTPENFTHGSSEQRARWYKKGFEAGDLSQFDSFDTEKYPTVNDL